VAAAEQLGRIVALPKTVLITGCSSPQGIGFATARGLAHAGLAVHATVRDRSQVAALLDGVEDRLAVHQLDLLDRESLTHTVESILASDGCLDVLINNAGYGLIGGVEQVEIERARANFETNFFGTVALIQEVLPVMRRQNSGHIVNVSTVFAASLCPPALGYYIASKAALECVTQALAVEAAPWGLRVSNFQPGPVLTELSREWGGRLPASEDPRPSLSDELYAWVLGGDAPAPQSPSEAADALCELVRSESPSLARQSGMASEAFVAAALRDPTRDAELARLLEQFSGRAGGGSEPPSGSAI
jgi:NAD(P)-dependent dehydrogenase (short-subunit alcohol dehydrogenase family)